MQVADAVRFLTPDHIVLLVLQNYHAIRLRCGSKIGANEFGTMQCNLSPFKMGS